jgi:sugar diacid utilization regulator
MSKEPQKPTYRRLDRKIFENKTLHDLIEYISGCLQNPVTVETPYFELISYSGNYEVLDSVRRDTILGKKAPAYLIECFIEEKVIELIESSEGPVRVPAIERVGFSKRVAVCVRHDDEILGYLWVQETARDLTDKDFEFLRDTAKEAAKIMVKNRIILRTVEDQLVSKLIEGHYTNEKMVVLEAEMSGVELPKEYSVIVFYSAKKDYIKRIKKYVQPYCIYENKHSFLLEKEKQLIVVVGKDGQTTITTDQIAKRLVKMIFQLDGIDKKSSLVIGVSATSTNILQMKSLYMEALEVINIRKSFGIEHIPFIYNNLGIYRMLSTIQEKYAAEGYVNETIYELKKYDAENQTELLITLEQYIKNNCKAKETAHDLFIHPNTLSYRLKRIFGLTDINLDDMNQRTTLYIDFLLQKYRD